MTNRLRADPAQEPKVRYLAKGTVPDHGEGWVSPGHRDYDYLEWIARLTSHIPERGTQLVHYYGAYSNAHRGIARRREVFIGIPPEDEPSDPPRPDSPWLAARRRTSRPILRDPTVPGLRPAGNRGPASFVASTRSILSFAVAASGCVSSGSLPSHQSSSRSSITSGGVSTR